jgi:putative membrane protein
VSADKKQPKSKRHEPDARFLLANERTLLAWIRTSLAVMAGGVALTQLGNDSREHSVIGVTAIMLGGFMASVGYLRFKEADKAIRDGKLPATGSEPFIQVGGVAVIGLALVITRLFGIW